MTDLRRILEAGLAQQQAGNLSDAEATYRLALRQDPQNADALHLLGVLRTQRGDPGQGIELIRRAIAVRPGMPMFHNNLGKALADQKDWTAAIAAYRRAVEIEPRYAEAFYNLGVALNSAKAPAEAEAAYRRALELAPGHLRARGNLGTLLLDLGRLDDAEACLRAGLEMYPDDADLLFKLGCACRMGAKLDAAEAALRRSISLRPDFGAAYTWLGGIRLELDDLEEAELLLRRSLALASDDATALVTYGQVRMNYADFPEVWNAYRKAIATRPADTLARRQILMVPLYDPSIDAASRASLHREFGVAMVARVEKALPPPSNDRDPERQLRVGWLSSDFRQHPVARNLESLFTYRDRVRTEFVCYAEVEQPDTMTEWYRGKAELWRSTVGLSDAQVAAQIRSDRIDVMVYLAGRFDYNRPQVAAWRPAPVQVSFHDPATSGLAAMGYLIADPMLVPRHPSEYFSERVVRLPSFYLHRALDQAPAIGPLPMRTSGAVTFGSFNNPTKLSRATLELWREILRRLPSARLRFKYKALFANAGLQERIRREMGDAAGRVDFETARWSYEQNLEQFNRVDVALDPFPFTGSTTTFEALWMGVPVVTLLGGNMAARWSASILHTLKLDELIAQTPAEYVEIAVRLAGDPSRLEALRTGLRGRVAASPLCDEERRARQIERLLRGLWRRWCRQPAN